MIFARTKRLLLVALLSGSAVWAEPTDHPPVPGRVVDRVVATAAGEVITLSELEFEARVALVRRGGVEAARNPLEDDALRSALDLAIAQRLLTAEADRLQAYPIDETQLSAEVERFRERFADAGSFERFLARHEMDNQHLLLVLARELRAERVLEGKVRLRAQVSEAEVRAYYQEHAGRLGGKYEELRASIREKLLRERFEAAAAAEIAQARKSADVRLVAPFAVGPEGASR